jgi:hypothetical protein
MRNRGLRGRRLRREGTPPQLVRHPARNQRSVGARRDVSLGSANVSTINQRCVGTLDTRHPAGDQRLVDHREGSGISGTPRFRPRAVPPDKVAEFSQAAHYLDYLLFEVWLIANVERLPALTVPRDEAIPNDLGPPEDVCGPDSGHERSVREQRSRPRESPSAAGSSFGGTHLQHLADHAIVSSLYQLALQVRRPRNNEALTLPSKCPFRPLRAGPCRTAHVPIEDG